MKSQFLLIHGAWHGAWCWELVAPLLEAAGHEVIAPDLPGMGSDPTPVDSMSVDSWARFVVETAGTERGPVILVGHSRAGIVISRAAELAPERFLGLVYLAAFLVDNGQTLEQVMRQIPPRAESAGSLELSADGSFSRIAPDAVERVFYNTSPSGLVARARELSCREPMASFTTHLAISPERWGSVPRFYIECAHDRAIAPELQRRMQARLPCEGTLRLNTDHSPFYSAPTEVAEHLLEIAGLLHARPGSRNSIGEA